MNAALLAIAAGNTCFIAWSHRSLRKDIAAAADSLAAIISGRVREVGPVEAQTQALQKQAVERATARRIRPATLNL